MIYKAELQKKLLESHDAFAESIKKLADLEFELSANNKWTAGQQLDHIVRSVGPVKTAFSLPAFMLKTLFGKANRPSRTYDALVEKYKTKLSEGGKASGRFIPKIIQAKQKDQLLKKLQQLIGSLSTKLQSVSEHDLDQFVLPHPLLGKLTLREMIYFTIYHVQHHHAQVNENLKGR